MLCVCGPGPSGNSDLSCDVGHIGGLSKARCQGPYLFPPFASLGLCHA
jgi:hypothetical protein